MTDQTVTGSSYATTEAPSIASICDIMIALNFIDTGRRIDRKMTVIKSRGAHHSTMYQNFEISDNGILLFPKNTAKDDR